jgi:hypothetical protein
MVIRRARSLLTQLEERALGTRPQLDLFVATPPTPPPAVPEEDALRNRLAAIDLDGVSPREAHLLLDELQRLAQSPPE